MIVWLGTSGLDAVRPKPAPVWDLVKGSAYLSGYGSFQVWWFFIILSSPPNNIFVSCSMSCTQLRTLFDTSPRQQFLEEAFKVITIFHSKQIQWSWTVIHFRSWRMRQQTRKQSTALCSLWVTLWVYMYMIRVSVVEMTTFRLSH